MEGNKRPSVVGQIDGIDVYDEIPDGWKDISHIVGARSGYHWINNGKSIFSKDYQHGLLRLTDEK